MTAQKYLELFSATNEADLEKAISKISELDKKEFIKTMIQFFHEKKNDNDINDFIQFSQELSSKV